MCKQLRLNHKAFEQARQIKQQIKTNIKRLKISLQENDDYDDPESIIKSLLAGFYKNVAIRVSNGKYRQIDSNKNNDEIPLEIHPMSVLNNICPEFVIYTDLLWTEKHKYMMNVSKIDQQEWLFETGKYTDKTNDIIKSGYLAEID